MSDIVHKGNNIFTPQTIIYNSEKDNPTIENDCVDSAELYRCFQPGCIWINNTTEQAFMCIKSDIKNALWKQITI